MKTNKKGNRFTMYHWLPRIQIRFPWCFRWKRDKFRSRQQVFPSFSLPTKYNSLHLACRLGKCDAVEAILNYEDINSNDGMEHHGVTPLHTAIIYEKYDLAMWLLQQGAFVGAVANNGWTPLHVASSMGCVEIVQCLLDVYKADNRSRDSRGWTPLFVAIFRGHIEVIRILLGKEVCIQDIIDDKDYYGQTILMTACQGGHEEVVEMLLTMGVNNIHARDQDGLTAFTYAKRRTNSGSLLNILQKHSLNGEMA